ncbi:MAG: pyridoxal-phosphate dependent enzyme, partial [Caldilineaceae bacterium]|nr:pyridoxal-phosphate dependent enzyme [Caldilineaceae bacterium]
MSQFIFSPFIKSLTCLRCSRAYSRADFFTEHFQYVCNCRPNQLSDVGTLDVQYDYAAIRQSVSPPHIQQDADRSIGRYGPLLPLAARTSLPPVAVGNTPFWAVDRLGEMLGLSALYVKDDGRNPSASLKDRASAIAVALAQENRLPVVATASTGNAAAALAGQSAAAGQDCVIFVPKTAPRAKIAQLLVYGSTVLTVDGSYDDAFDLCTAACKEFGWFNRNTGYNPFMTEGKKTVAFEIAEQLGHAQERANGSVFVAPDVVFVSVGDGCIIGGVHKGFKDLLALGWIKKMPRLYGVQAAGS